MNHTTSFLQNQVIIISLKIPDMIFYKQKPSLYLLVQEKFQKILIYLYYIHHNKNSNHHL